MAQDVDRGLASVDGARRYGVVLLEGARVDAAATAALREQMAAGRGELPLFDRGGSVAEIIARAREETHLEPPKPPRFTRAGAA